MIACYFIESCWFRSFERIGPFRACGSPIGHNPKDAIGFFSKPPFLTSLLVFLHTLVRSPLSECARLGHCLTTDGQSHCNIQPFLHFPLSARTQRHFLTCLLNSLYTAFRLKRYHKAVYNIKTLAKVPVL